MLKKALQIGLAAKFVAAEMFLEFRNIAIEVFYKTLNAIIAAMYK